MVKYIFYNGYHVYLLKTLVFNHTMQYNEIILLTILLADRSIKLTCSCEFALKTVRTCVYF